MARPRSAYVGLRSPSGTSSRAALRLPGFRFRGARGTDTALVTATGVVGGSQRWAKRFGSAGLDSGYGVATDASGNVVMTGHVEQQTDLGGVVCPAGNLFIVRYSAAGGLQWGRCVAHGQGRAVAIDLASAMIPEEANWATVVPTSELAADTSPEDAVTPFCQVTAPTRTMAALFHFGLKTT